MARKTRAIKRLVILVNPQGEAKLPRGWKTHFRTDLAWIKERDKAFGKWLERRNSINATIIINNEGEAKLPPHMAAVNKVLKELRDLSVLVENEPRYEVYEGYYTRQMKCIRQLERLADFEDPLIVLLDT